MEGTSKTLRILDANIQRHNEVGNSLANKKVLPKFTVLTAGAILGVGMGVAAISSGFIAASVLLLPVGLVASAGLIAFIGMKGYDSKKYNELSQTLKEQAKEMMESDKSDGNKLLAVLGKSVRREMLQEFVAINDKLDFPFSLDEAPGNLGVWYREQHPEPKESHIF